MLVPQLYTPVSTHKTLMKMLLPLPHLVSRGTDVHQRRRGHRGQERQRFCVLPDRLRPVRRQGLRLGGSKGTPRQHGLLRQRRPPQPGTVLPHRLGSVHHRSR